MPMCLQRRDRGCTGPETAAFERLIERSASMVITIADVKHEAQISPRPAPSRKAKDTKTALLVWRPVLPSYTPKTGPRSGPDAHQLFVTLLHLKCDTSHYCDFVHSVNIQSHICAYANEGR